MADHPPSEKFLKKRVGTIFSKIYVESFANVGEAAKKYFFLVARPLRSYPLPSSLVATKKFPEFFRASKNGIFS